jgi:phage/plasmid-associated DNA primase
MFDSLGANNQDGNPQKHGGGTPKNDFDYFSTENSEATLEGDTNFANSEIATIKPVLTMRLGLIDCEVGSVQKRLYLDPESGQIQKDGQHFQGVVRGLFQNVTVADPLAGLAEVLANLKTTQAITLGICGDDKLKTLVTGDELAALADPTDTIARNQHHLIWPLLKYLLLDHDPEPGKPELTADQFILSLTESVPELLGIGRVVTTSTSSEIYDSVTGDCLRGAIGHHTYLVAKGDVARFTELLKIRLWASGKAFFKLSTPNRQTGVPAILERFLLDMMVFGPERIIYESGAICDGGIEQRRSAPQVYPGDILDLDKLPAPTEDEIALASANRNAALEAMKPLQFRATIGWYCEQGLSKPLARIAATDAILRYESSVLSPFHVLHLKNGATVIAKNLTAAHDGELCQDPQEPDYRGGACCAKIYQLPDGSFYVNSFAHGGAKYRVQSETEWLIDQIVVETDKGPRKLAPASKIAAALASIWGGEIAYNDTTKTFLQYGAEFPGLWTERSETLIRQTIQEAIETTGIGYSSDVIRSILKLLQSKLAVTKWREKKGVTPMRNGVLDNATLNLMPHSPTNYLCWQLPYDYNPLATCEPIQEWLSFTQDGDFDRVQLLRAYLKATVMGRSDLQRFLEVVATVGGSGKTTYCNLAIALVGIENVHITDSHRLEQSRFETACFKNKRLIYFADSGRFSGEKAIDVLKRVTGGEPLAYERKGKDALAPFSCQAMVLIASNYALTTTDTAVPRRRITMPFLKPIPNEKQRKLLVLNTEDNTLSGEFEPCIPGLLNWVLAMPDAEMERYLKDTDRAVPSLAAVKADTLISINPMAAWLDKCCVILPGVRTNVGNATEIRISEGENGTSKSWKSYARADEWLYPNYLQCCDRDKQAPVSMRRFGEMLNNLVTDQLKHVDVIRDSDRNGAYFLGIAIRNESHDHLPCPISGRCDEIVTEVGPIIDEPDTTIDSTGLSTGDWDEPEPIPSTWQALPQADRQDAVTLLSLLKQAETESDRKKVWYNPAKYSDPARAAVKSHLNSSEWGRPIIQQLFA